MARSSAGNSWVPAMSCTRVIFCQGERNDWRGEGAHSGGRREQMGRTAIPVMGSMKKWVLAMPLPFTEEARESAVDCLLGFLPPLPLHKY